MMTLNGAEKGLSGAFARLFYPFDTPRVRPVRAQLLMLQHERLRSHIPLICLAISLTAVAATLSLLGDLPWFQQLAPPAAIIAGAASAFWHFRRGGAARDSEEAARALLFVPRIAATMGLVAGLWCVSAFTETEKFYCVVAPVFVALGVLTSANCLSGVPHAATAAVIGSFTPITIKMLLFPNLGIRSIAVMMIILATMQLIMIYGKFGETVRTLIAQAELEALATTDGLTGLANRRSFSARLEAALSTRRPITLAMIDLDGFKGANDCHGHQAGDAILSEVGARLRQLCGDALSVARLGGDEFAIIFDRMDGKTAVERARALRTLLALPYGHDGSAISISASIGIAHSPEEGLDAATLMHTADRGLYREKALHKNRDSFRRAG